MPVFDSIMKEENEFEEIYEPKPKKKKKFEKKNEENI